jgi:hypothetical protein
MVDIVAVEKLLLKVKTATVEQSKEEKNEKWKEKRINSNYTNSLAGRK